MAELHHLGNSPEFNDNEFSHEKFKKIEDYLTNHTEVSIVLSFLYKKDDNPTDLSKSIELEYGRNIIYPGKVDKYCRNLKELGILDVSGYGLDSKYKLTDDALEFEICFRNKFGNTI